MKYKQFVSWNNLNIQSDEYDIIANYINDNDIRMILEFGIGASTYALLEYLPDDGEIYSFEYRQNLIDLYSKKFKDYPRIHINRYKNMPNISLGNAINNISFDLSLVNSPQGDHSPNYPETSRYNTLKYAIQHSKNAFFRDSFRLPEMRSVERIQTEHDITGYQNYNTITGLILL